MIKKVDHLGIAVRDLAESASRWRDLLGYELYGMEDVPGRDVRVAFLRQEGSPPVELITPLEEGSAVDRFLNLRGEGVHHICYEVDDIRKARDSLKADGVRFVGEAPGPGAEGAETIFIHPESFNGVLIELKQKS
jgi:methylmalonyl-CoA/ethylmalonyl-CoA epimerase